MNVRTWLSAALVVGLVSLAASPGSAQERAGRAERVEPAPAPARAKQAKIEPKRAEAARQAGSAQQRTARMRR